MAKILVTGGLGFIGHNVVALLERLGHSVVVTDTQTTYGIIPQEEITWLIAERRKKIKTDRVYTIDITNADSIEWLVSTNQFDAIIHLASFPRQKVVNSDPAWGSSVMSEGLLNLLTSSGNNSVNKFVYVSSSMVYGNFIESVSAGIDESHPCEPIGAYGIMKLAGEWLVRDHSRRTGQAHVIIRPSAVYGPLDVEDRVVSKFLLNARRGRPVVVNGVNEGLDFTHVTDVAQGIVQATLSDNTHNRTYNLTRGQERTLLDVAKLAISIVGQGQLQINTPDADFPTRGQLNIQHAVADFGYNPTVDIEQGFKEYYSWIDQAQYYSV